MKSRQSDTQAPTRQGRGMRRLAHRVVWLALAALPILVVAIGAPMRADDRDLLRTGGGQPSVFFLIDTSASMALKLGEGQNWSVGWADGPDSRLYQAKQAIYNVFADLDDVDVGIATYNQNRVRVKAKHWLYFSNTPLTGAWPLQFPRADTVCGAGGAPNCLTTMIETPVGDTNGDGEVDGDDEQVADTRVSDLQGDVMTFGAAYVDASNQPIPGGTCGAPLNLNVPLQRQRAQAFAISSATEATPTVMWVREGTSGPVYQLNVSFTGVLGVDGLAVKLVARQRIGNQCNPPSLGTPVELTLNMRLDPNLGESLVVDAVIDTTSNDGHNCGREECRTGLWDWADVESTTAGTSNPFSGLGWEGNYDSGDLSGNATFDANVTNFDRFCLSAPEVCREVRPVEHTTYSPLGRALDRGDVLPLPLSGAAANTVDILNRVKPMGLAGRDFRGAPFFVDNGNQLSEALELMSPNTRPLLAADVSPLSSALLDFRCWFSGSDSSNKCPNNSPYEEGYRDLACEHDSGVGCRVFYFIVITDGEDNMQGPGAPSRLSDGNEFDNRVWFLNVKGVEGTCRDQPLWPILQNTDSRDNCITADNPATLKEALLDILGEIREDVRAFASAAVPSVQATVEQKIFLTSFIPVNNEGFWPSRVDAFLAPLPLDDSGKPDFSEVCDADTQEGCHLWNANESEDANTTPLLMQTPDRADGEPPLAPDQYLGDGEAQRRVYYAPRAEVGSGADLGWGFGRELLIPPVPATDDPPVKRCDLWRGFGLIDEDVPCPTDSTQVAARDAELARILVGTEDGSVTGVLQEKTTLVDEDGNPETPGEIPRFYVAGDTFHSTPLVVGTPPNTTYFVRDFGNDGDPDTECSEDDEERGYRCFFFQHRFRRKMLVMGANDGQLHAYDAGIFHGDNDQGTIDGDDPITNLSLSEKFDNGVGWELFAYMPRAAMPAVRTQTEEGRQDWGVDGPPVAADAWIDPDGADELERQWRTVLIGGLREGGGGYYALDITRPDPIEDVDGPVRPYFVPEATRSGANDTSLPACHGIGSLPSECDTPFPNPLWEYDGSFPTGTGAIAYEDLDGNGISDLGDTWSAPNTGLIKVCVGGGSCDPGDEENLDIFDDAGDIRAISVAVFGGGMDVESKLAPAAALRGNWLYMVDIETGRVIYKQPLVGAAPSSPAAVDTNQDGFLDRIYIGTLAGKLYRVDLDTVVPELEPVEIRTTDCDPGTEDCPVQNRITASTAPEWEPYVLFDAQFDAATGAPAATPRSIFFRPSVLSVAGRSFLALAFGTGDREDLFTLSEAEGRFYVVGDTATGENDSRLPFDEGDLPLIAPTDDPVDATANFLLAPATETSAPGWYLKLQPDERVITDAFSLSGVTVFSSFEPEIVITGGGSQICGEGPGGGGGGGGGGGDNDVPVCSRQGSSNIFGVNTTNANGLLAGMQDTTTGEFDLVRFTTVDQFVSNPFAESSATKNVDGEPDGQDNGSALDERLTHIMETLKSLFPQNCTFANYRIDIKTITADTSLEFIAPVPVCIIEKNWKEF